tara:strand:+ start:22461 stop:22637 length:177 start_codon:yes stop_codon:yes gene_type:complete
METTMQMEELLFNKMQRTFSQRFNLESSMATELALELVEVLSASDANLIDFDSIYFNS